MIALEDVTKRYGGGRRSGGVLAINALTLHVDAGDTIAIAGPNGAGKSTLLGLILGFLRPTRGVATLDGMLPRDYLRASGAAWLSERFQLPPEWPVEAALNAFGRLEGMKGDAAKRRTSEMLERLDLGAVAKRAIGTLSRGQLQRVGLAQTFLVPRRLVVLDEPTEGLDPRGRVQFRELVAEQRSWGATIVIASQDLAEVERIANRAVVLANGGIRESLELNQPPEEGRWTLRLTRPHAAVAELFPGATPLNDGDADASFAITARDPSDLSTRLAALIHAGATVLEVTPVRPSLEQRVRLAMETSPTGDGTP